MWLLVLTVGAAVIIVVITGGSFTGLSRLPVRGGWILACGIVLQAIPEIVQFRSDQIDTLGYGILMASFAFIIAFSLLNMTMRGFGVIALGIAMNALVIGLNQGMPTIPIGNDAEGNRVRKVTERTVKHRPERDTDLLQVLDDHIVFPEPFDTVVSFGDLVMAVGICELAYSGSRRRRRRSAGSRQPSPPSRPRRSRTRSSTPSTRPS